LRGENFRCKSALNVNVQTDHVETMILAGEFTPVYWITQLQPIKSAR